MAVIPEQQRLQRLQELGLSAPLIRLAAGDPPHDLFQFYYPPFYVYRGADTPPGPLLIPLWDDNDSVTGLWQHESGLEFLEFDIETPHEYWPLARTEQGLFANMFVTFYENTDDIDEVREAASRIGFRYLNDVIHSYEGASHSTSEEHEVFLRMIVERIDAIERGV